MKQLILISLLLICSKAFSQQTIFATDYGDSLFSFDLTNCTRHVIGTTGQGFLDMAFTPDGQLWGIGGSNLYHIDTTTANTTLVGNMGISPISLVDLNDTTLLVVFNYKLYSINVTDATSYYIDTIGYSAAGDLTWYDNDLYMVTSTTGQIIKMVLNSTNTSLLGVTPIGNTIPGCEGAVTASFVGDYNSIVGFNGPNLIKICQIDGSYQMLCPSLNIGGTPSAASIRLATQVPQPTSCSITGIENLAANNLFSIFPNPVTNELKIKINFNQKYNFNIYNTLGQLVKTGILETNNTTVYISELTNGIYSIELLANSKIDRNCFIVEKSCR